MKTLAMTKKQTSGGVLLLILFLAVLLAVFLTYPKYNDWKEKQQEITDATAQLSKIKTDSDTASQYITNINTPDFDNVDLAVPSEPSLGDMYAHIENLSKQSNVLLNSVQALADDSGDQVAVPDATGGTSNLIKTASLPSGLGVISLSIEINGSLADVQQFLSSLYSSLRIIDLQSLTMSANTDATSPSTTTASSTPTTINAKIQAQAYYSKPL
jgi:Tfp pilus assembly protein PilO